MLNYNDPDTIDKLLKKGVTVIKSCKTIEQLGVAKNYISLINKKFLCDLFGDYIIKKEKELKL